MDSKSVYLKVSEPVHALLEEEARRDGVPMSVVVRRAVLEHYGVYADGTQHPKRSAR
jgi:hypothetical protein